jgi:uncharacterized phage protein (TIGR01671 family)
MREILFRGKRVDNGGWVQGFLTINPKYGQTQAFFIEYVEELKTKEGRFNGLKKHSYLVFPESVGQYTGLKDKNGIKIFEGDIIKHINRNEIYTCVWVEDYACFAFIEDIEFGEGYYFQKVDEERLSIIGNVHDNPDKINSKPQ